MAVQKIYIYGSRILRQKAKGVPLKWMDAVQNLIRDLLDTAKATNAVGLSANQIGSRAAVMVFKAKDGWKVAVNPAIIAASLETEVGVEGCLSIPGIQATVERPKKIHMLARDKKGAVYAAELEGLEARIVQHEIDHLSGMFFTDRISAVKRDLLLKRWKKQFKKAMVPA